MIVLSWDVGITHLAYCIVKDDYDVKTGKHNIDMLDWENIDLLEEDRIAIPCCGMMKSKKGCQKMATYQQTLLSGEELGYCKTHLSQHENHWKTSDTENLFVSLEKHDDRVCDYVPKSGEVCGKRAHMICKTDKKMYYCNTHGKSIRDKMVTQLSPQMIRKVLTDDFATAEVQMKLVRQLDKLLERFRELGVRGVVIENQPVKKNARMKSIANTLYDYFMIRGQVDGQLALNFVTFFAASNKLRINEDNTMEVFNANDDESKKYQITKKLGIEYTKKLLHDDEISLMILSMHRKKDDLCDCYLQGRYYLEQRHNFDTGMPKTATTKKKPRTVKPRGTNAKLTGSKTAKPRATKTNIGGSKTAKSGATKTNIGGSKTAKPEKKGNKQAEMVYNPFLKRYVYKSKKAKPKKTLEL